MQADFLKPKGEAVISTCGLYRYLLTRTWDLGRQKLAFVMLNPSTATADVDDPTIRRCQSFARREGFGGVAVLNLFAFRSTDPDVMRACPHPVGPENDAWLMMAAKSGAPVIAAWGVHGVHQGRDAVVKRMFAETGEPLKCLGLTKDGHPRHPLYVRGDAPLVALP